MKKITMSLMKILVYCLIYGALALSTASAQEADFSLSSQILGETRKIIVHLPAAYDANHQDGYTVIYMLDAGNYDALTAEAAGAHHTAGIMPEVIVVTIENIRRGYDFTPPYEMFGRGDDSQKGNGDRFLAFIKEELIPKVNEKFRTNGHQVFMGHSWGGAFVAYLLSQSPDLFEGFFLFSPTILYGPTIEESTDKLFADFTAIFNQDVKLPAFVYVSVGEDERARFKESYQSLAVFLEQHLPSRVRLHLETTAGAGHMENPEISIPRALEIWMEN